MKKYCLFFVGMLLFRSLEAQNHENEVVLAFNRIVNSVPPSKQLKTLDSFLIVHPNFANGYVFRSKLHQKSNNYDAGLHDCNKAFDLDPNLQTVFEERGRIYLALTKYADAIQDFRTSIGIKPFVETYNILGYAYELRGDLENALKNYEQSLNQKPDFSEAKNNLARVRAKILNPHNEIVRLLPLTATTTTSESCFEICFALKYGKPQMVQMKINQQIANRCSRGIDMRSKDKYETTLLLQNGQNDIEIQVVDEQNRTLSQRFIVHRKESRLALLVGNKDYPIAPLTNPINDVDSMQKMLISKQFEVIREQNVNNKGLFEQKIDQLIERGKDKDVLLFFFAGHGQEIDLIPNMIGISEEGKNGLSIEVLFSKLKKIQVADKKKLFIVIIDACRSAVTRQVNAELEKLMPENTIVGFATFSGENALDLCGKNGCYTKAFLEAAQKPNLNLNDVFNQARAILAVNTAKKQQSIEKTTLLQGIFQF